MAMMAKVSKDSVNYRPATNNKRCGNCAMYSERLHDGRGTCSLVEGSIRRHDTCDKWQAKK
jgi:High potential iron-sulfur protein